VDPAQLPAVYGLEVVALAERWGVGREELLEGLGLTLEGMKDPAARLPLAICVTLTERACLLTGEPGLALYMGMQMRLSWHGFLGFAAMTASTVREALDLAVRMREVLLRRAVDISFQKRIGWVDAHLAFQCQASAGARSFQSGIVEPERGIFHTRLKSDPARDVIGIGHARHLLAADERGDLNAR